MRRLLVLAAAFLLAVPAAGAAELKVLSTMAMRSVMEEMIPQFERASGHKVTIAYDTANIMAKQLQDGAVADLVVLTPALIEQLAKQGKVIAGSNVTLARSGVGIAIRAGAPKPDLGSAAAVKKALLDAKSIAYTATGQSGTYFASLIEKMGIAAEVKAKARIPAGGSTGELVAKNEARNGSAADSGADGDAGHPVRRPAAARNPVHDRVLGGRRRERRAARRRRGLCPVPRHAGGGQGDPGKGHGALSSGIPFNKQTQTEH